MIYKPVGFLLFLCSVLSFDASGQKKFSAMLVFPASLDISKLVMYADDGKSQSLIQNSSTKKGTVTLSGKYYSSYAAIIVQYPISNHLHHAYSFFLKSKPALIRFSATEPNSSPFENDKLVNAWNFKDEKKRLKEYNGVEVKQVDSIINLLGSNPLSDLDSASKEKLAFLQKKLFEKNMAYIAKTSNSYYSFWYFKTYLSRPYYLTPDSTLHFFNSTFPLSFKNNAEGSSIKKRLTGMLEIKKGFMAPDFTATDIKGKTVSLKTFNGEKYVLLGFWATWCVPCIRELPALRAIRDSFARQNLEMISVSYQSKLTTTRNVIKKQRMNWINIYNDADIINSFGGSRPIPLVYLIDKSGIIVYDSGVDESNIDDRALGLPNLRQYLDHLRF